MQTVTEPSREIPVVDRVDVLVVGGGPAGFIAATAAARLGARVMLIERYGCLGGLATGGIVLHMMAIFDRAGERWIGGLPWETLERLDAMDGMCSEGPTRPHADSELLKVVADEMCMEAGVTLRLHSWGVNVLTEGGRVTGVVVESKSGRQAILSQICIDATGDGDIAALAGVDYEMGAMRIGLPLKVGGVDLAAFQAFEKRHPERAQALVDGVTEKGGYRLRPRPTPYSEAGICWVNINGLDRHDDQGANGKGDAAEKLSGVDVEDLSYAEVELRRRTLDSLAFYREHAPGFESVSLLAFASQLGVRDSRHIRGAHTLTREAVLAAEPFDDAIGNAAVSFADVGHYQIPYRCLVPEGIEGLLIAGRCISVDHWIINSVRLIPPCMVTGQAAGTAAALALTAGVSIRDLDTNTLRYQLAGDGAIL